jgi:exodeoxyribonuclease VII large subunit
LRIAAQQRIQPVFRLARAAPEQRAAAARANLAGLSPRLARAMMARLSRDRAALDALARRMRSAGPEETLQRGYAIVTDARGALVRAASVAAGASVTTWVENIGCDVEVAT